MKVRRKGRFLTFVFNDEELPGLLSAMRGMDSQKPLELTSHWEGSGGDLRLKLCMADNDEILIEERQIVMNLESDSLEYAIHKLDEMIFGKGISTPEFLEFWPQDSKSNRHIKNFHTYFELEKSHE